SSLSTDALYPFDQPSADTVLRTSDKVTFRVHSHILALASPSFATMMALPQPASTENSDAEKAGAAQPVIDVSEDAGTLELLLRLVYPVTKPELGDPMAVFPALKAGLKYETDLPVQIFSKHLLALALTQPVLVWAAACRASLEDVAHQAAAVLRTSHLAHDPDTTRPEALEELACLGDMAGISAGDYFRLKQFLRADPQDGDCGSMSLLRPTKYESVSLPSSPPAPHAAPGPHSSRTFTADIPSTDVVCKSSSHGPEDLATSFAVHQSVLSIHSLVWRMRLAELKCAISGTTGAASPSPNKVVLELEEGPELLSRLLSVCYHGTDGLASASLDMLAKLTLAAKKYEMPLVIGWIHSAWDRGAASSPLETYFVALNHRLLDYARAAAAKVLERPAKDWSYVHAMEAAPALAYHRLLKYCDRC
ncbi:hypothetical protein BV20DRAFT_919703, partial [Pilatotrama ljubarskyi]